MKTLDPRVDTRLDRSLASAMSKLGKAYIIRKVTAWCHWFLPKQLDPAAAAEAGAHSAAVEAVAAGLVMPDVE